MPNGPDATSERTPQPEPKWGAIRTGLTWGAIIAFTLAALVGGLAVRNEAWFRSEGAHFRGDISAGWQWGALANRSGLFHFYEAIASGQSVGRARKNDYPPLRIAAMSAWQSWTERHYPGARGWRDEYEFTAPLLYANTAAELASAVLTFLLIRHWRIRQDDARRRDAQRPALVPPRRFRGLVPGMAGAMICWFNPALIWNGHAWPQWDVWLVPWFLGAALAGSMDLWFTAGALVLVGAFFKGQMLLGAPVLVLWPLFAGRLGAVGRWVAGFLFAGAVLSLPWMLPSAAALGWLGCIAGAIVLLAPFVFRVAKIPLYISAPLAAAALALAYPWAAHDAEAFSLRWGSHVVFAGSYRALIFVPMLLLVATRALPRARPHVIALTVASAIFLTIPIFHGNTDWFDQGFEYGTQKFDFMTSGTGTFNVPAMLEKYFLWPQSHDDAVAIPFLATTVPFDTLMRVCYAVTLVLCGIGAAIQSRRNDPRILAALAAPWLLFYMILTQMHGRYPVWAAALAGLLAGISPGMAAIAVLVSVIAAAGIIENQLAFVRDWSPEFYATLVRLTPDLGWALVLAAAIYLYVSLAPRRRRCPDLPSGNAGG